MTASDAEWIVVADGEKARFLVRAANAAVRTMKIVEAGEPSLAWLGFEAMALGQTRLQQAHDRFAALVAAHLNAAAGAGLFGRLVLAAPARVLQALEADLDHPARSRVALRIDKDLTHVPDGELVLHLPPGPG